MNGLTRTLQRLRGVFRGGPPQELVLLDRQIQQINRFPDQNPNPVMRITEDGHLVYANIASRPITSVLGVSVNDLIPDETLAALKAAAADPARPPVEIETESGRQTFAVWPVPIAEFGFMNLYGTDVTATKVIDKFPRENPNPVFRVSNDGRLIYANAASAPLIRGFGVELGEPLPEDWVRQLRSAMDPAGAGRVEVRSEGRTYALKPVPIEEFSFINVYGTDVTALKALDKFPDQNPNPVLRLSREGVLMYANPASARIVRAFETAVGDPLNPDLQARIFAHLDPTHEDEMEVEAEGRLYSLLVRSVYEFGFVNLYGTDITAQRQVEVANRENERLLLNILPSPIAARLRAGERIIADRAEDVTLMFADIVDFTRLSSGMSAYDVVHLLNEVFGVLDRIVEKHRVEKIKTIGDAYVIVGGLPQASPDDAERVADVALEFSSELGKLRAAVAKGLSFRIGINRGPAVAGVIGQKRTIYDVWGDTVNIASRMESEGQPGKIQVTPSVYESLRDRYLFEPRGTIEIRGKGPMQTYFLVRKLPAGARLGAPAELGERANLVS